MSTTAVEIAPLTAEDVKALKQAEKIIFRNYQGKSTVEASLEHGWSESARIYTATQQRLFPRSGSIDGDRERVIEVSGSITGYDENATRRPAGSDSRAFAWFPSAQFSDRWWTISSLLRAGDVLHLGFEANGYSNGVTKQAGVHADTLTLRIRRAGASRDLVFLLDVSVCYDNTARMVQVRG